ncbi:hypothetical protein CRUP_020130 [Coryphaenoides rupestris]|nr:hypothetical protein CRUP_020130 [Coryphaenoides rupestris]
MQSGTLVPAARKVMPMMTSEIPSVQLMTVTCRPDPQDTVRCGSGLRPQAGSRERKETKGKLRQEEHQRKSLEVGYKQNMSQLEAQLQDTKRRWEDLQNYLHKVNAEREKLQCAKQELQNQLQVDLLSKSNAELSKNSKKMQQQIKELQAQIEEEVQSGEERCEEQAAGDRENQEALTALETTERARKALETELQDATEIRGMAEQAKKAGKEWVCVAEELRLEQEHVVQLQRVKKGLEVQVKYLGGAAEQAGLKGGKKIIQKLEGKVKELELELDSEQKRHGETVKTLRKNERRLKELAFQSEEDQKNQLLMQELVERLQKR